MYSDHKQADHSTDTANKRSVDHSTDTANKRSVDHSADTANKCSVDHSADSKQLLQALRRHLPSAKHLPNSSTSKHSTNGNGSGESINRNQEWLASFQVQPKPDLTKTFHASQTGGKPHR